MTSRMQRLLDGFVEVAGERDEGAILTAALRLAADTLDASTGLGLLGDGEGIRVAVPVGLPAELLTRVTGAGALPGLVGRVLRGLVECHERLEDRDVSVEDGLGLPLGHPAVSAFLGVPVVHGEVRLGALCLTRGPGGGGFTGEDERFLRALARQVGQAVLAVRARHHCDRLVEQLRATNRATSGAVSELGNEVDPNAAIERILSAAKSNLRMDVAFVSELDGEVQRWAHRAGGGFDLRPGTETPAEAGYCQRMLTGAIPQVIPDTSREPAVARMPVTAEAGVGSYVGVPLVLPDGSLYGTLCCLSRRPRPDLAEGDLAFMRVLAELLGEQVARLEAVRTDFSSRVARLRPLCKGEGLAIVVQPIVDLRTGIRVGFEALSRFPARPDLPPGLVFSEAADVGLSAPLELAAVRAALALLPQLPQSCYLSVNLSPATVAEPELVRLLSAGDPSRVVLELTEHSPVPDYDQLAAQLLPLRRYGVRVAVDDAGAGFASLRHTVALAPDVIKLDLGLVRGVDADPARQALVAAFSRYAEELGTSLVAEGVETAAELAALLGLGVRYGQGYHLGRPAPLAQLPPPGARPAGSPLPAGYAR